jgi:hypothetical protein
LPLFAIASTAAATSSARRSSSAMSLGWTRSTSTPYRSSTCAAAWVSAAESVVAPFAPAPPP